MKKRTIFIIILFTLIPFLLSEYVKPTDIRTYIKAYGGTGYDNFSQIFEDSEGNVYILGEYANLPLITKIGVLGNVLFSKKYNGFSFAYTFVKTDDNSFVILSKKAIIKVDLNGNLIWCKKFSDDIINFTYSLIKTSDNGFLVGGVTSDTFGEGEGDIFFTKLNSNGEVVWSKFFGGDKKDCIYGIIQLQSGEYLAAGYTRSFQNKQKPLLIKLDSNGNMIWSKVYENIETSSIRYILKGSDGSIFLAGDTTLLKINSSGEIIWGRRLPHYTIEFIYQAPDGNLFITGHTPSCGKSTANLFYAKMDSNGNFLWGKIFHGDENDYGNSIFQTLDGGLLITGHTKSFGAGDYDGLLTKTDENGNVPNCKYLIDFHPELEDRSDSPVSVTLVENTHTVTVEDRSLDVSDITPTITTICCGKNFDLNSDGIEDVVDLCCLLNVLVGNLPVGEDYDLNCDGSVDVSDAEILSQFIVSNLFY